MKSHVQMQYSSKYLDQRHPNLPHTCILHLLPNQSELQDTTNKKEMPQVQQI